MKQLIFLSILCLCSFFAFAAKKKNVLPFQQEVNSCFPKEFSNLDIKKISEVYSVIDQKYTLSRSTLLTQETVFKENQQLKKLSYVDSKLSLFRVDDKGVVELISTDARQKNLTIESSISQLLIHADIRSDFSKVKEARVQGWNLVVERSDRQIKRLQIEQEGRKNVLVCAVENSTDICSCRSVN